MKIICIDIEANGLIGKPFAAGMVVLGDDDVESHFLARTWVVGPASKFVTERVVPVLDRDAVPMTHPRLLELEIAFMDRLNDEIALHPGALCFYDWAIPVDSGFLVGMFATTFRRLNQRGEKNRATLWHEVATLFLAAGMDPDTDRSEFVRDEMTGRESRKHNPVFDAEVSARAARRLLRRLGRWGG